MDDWCDEDVEALLASFDSPPFDGLQFQTDCAEVDRPKEISETTLWTSALDMQSEAHSDSLDGKILLSYGMSACTKAVLVLELDTILEYVGPPKKTSFPRMLTDEDDIYGSALEIDPIQLRFSSKSYFIRFRQHTALALAMLSSHFNIHVVSCLPQSHVRTITSLLKKSGIKMKIVPYNEQEQVRNLKSIDLIAEYILDDKVELWYPYRKLHPEVKIVRVEPMSLLSIASFCVFSSEIIGKIPQELRAESSLSNLSSTCMTHVFQYLDYKPIFEILGSSFVVPSFLQRYLRNPITPFAPYQCDICSSCFHKFIMDCPGCADMLNDDVWERPFLKRKMSTLETP